MAGIGARFLHAVGANAEVVTCGLMGPAILLEPQTMGLFLATPPKQRSPPDLSESRFPSPMQKFSTLSPYRTCPYVTDIVRRRPVSCVWCVPTKESTAHMNGAWQLEATPQRNTLVVILAVGSVSLWLGIHISLCTAPLIPIGTSLQFFVSLLTVTPFLSDVACPQAARGLDIKELQCVINFTMPKYIDQYVHRIGRTGRAGTKGQAVSFFNRFANRDCGLAKDLIACIKSAGQTPPDELFQFIGGEPLQRPPSEQDGWSGGGGWGGGQKQVRAAWQDAEDFAEPGEGAGGGDGEGCGTEGAWKRGRGGASVAEPPLQREKGSATVGGSGGGWMGGRAGKAKPR